MPRFKDDAIVLRVYEWSETSQVVVLLTANHGKVRGLAKGSKRQSPSLLQRFSGGIELLTLGQVIAHTKHTAELASITEWDQQAAYPHLRTDLQAQWLAMYAAELTAALLADLDTHTDVFDAMRRLLDALAGGNHQAALLVYQWLLLESCGYKPVLDRDTVHGGPLVMDTAYTFNPAAGGLTAARAAKDWRVREATVGLLRRVAEGDTLTDTDADAAAIARANRLLCAYARTLLDRDLSAMRLVMGV